MVVLAQTQVGLELGGSEGRFARGAYLTDGRQLFRVVSRIVLDRQAFVELEDCASLETVHVAQAELTALRPVRQRAAAVSARRSGVSSVNPAKNAPTSSTS
jgi:hypothetical protein